MEEPLFAPSVPSARLRTGCQKARGRGALPKPVFVFDRSAKAVTGCCLLLACRHQEGEAFVQWDVTRAVLAAQPLPIGSDVSPYIGAVVNLKSQAETRLRMAPALCGGTLGGHLEQFSKQVSWRVVMFGREPMELAYARPACMFSLGTRPDVARLLCVQPVLERGSQSQPAEVDASVFDNDDVDDEADETQTVNQPLPEPQEHSCVASHL